MNPSLALWGAIVILVLFSGTSIALWRREKARLAAAQRRFEDERASLITHFDHLTRYANDAILLFDADLRVIDANEAALRLYGYSLAQFRTLTMVDLRPSSVREGIEATVRWVNEVGGSRYETVHKSAKGKTFPVEATLRALELERGKAYQNIVRDISERKAQQQAMERLNVVYQLLAKVNRALFGSSDERQILQSVCHLAVQVGGYDAAAVYICEGETASIIAEEGIGPDVAARLAIDLAPPTTRDTVTARAIRENRMHFSNDYSPLQELGSRDRFGTAIRYGSLAACPLTRGGGVVGAIVLMVASTGFYTKEETALLEVLAGDISSALDLLAAQADLSAAQHRMRQLFTAIEQSPVSVVITDTSGVIEYANPKFVDVSGYSLEEVVGQNPRVLKSGEMSPEGYRELWQTISSGKVWRGEFHNRRKNGDLYWEAATIAPVRDEHGKITRYVAVKEDVTELKAQRELAAQVLRDLTAAEQKFRALFEDAPIPYHEIDRNGVLLRVNRAECELLGLEAGELIGKPVWQFIPASEQAHSRDRIPKKISGQLPLVPHACEYRGRNGHRILCEVHDRIIRDSAGTTVGIRSALLDITARTQAEQDRALALERAQEASLAKDRFLAVMSHELRTPLNGILGTTDLMLTTATGEDVEDLRQIRDCAVDLLELVERILAFADSEAAASNHLAPFRLADLIKELWKAIRPAAEQKGLQATLHLSPQVPETILADRKKIEMVLHSLLNNAIKFTRAGEIGLLADLGCQQNARCLTFQVWDTGAGIPADMKVKVFEAFFQTDMTNTREHGGVGLGLAIAARLAQSMGGRISIEDTEPVRGTRVQFVLPLPETPPHEAIV